jgi:phosphatidate cytidylyltransferase
MTEASRNLILRLATAAALIPILIALILWQKTYPLALVVHLAVVIGMAEFSWITLREDPPWLRIVGIGLGLGVSGIICWYPQANAILGAIIVSVLVIAVLHLIRFENIQTVSARMALMCFGIFYVPVLLTPLVLLKRLPDGSGWIFLLMTITWFGDSGAYFAGRAIGGPKLYPKISPGKTIAGAIGGLVASLGAALLAKSWYLPKLDGWDVLLLSLPTGALAQAGDLVESMIKRGYQVKDSGWIIPGHGGLLDRIDALLFSTPYVYLYAIYIFRA